jgi:CTD small phosphatase-like protein 2
MDNNQRFLLQSKNPFQNQINQPNMVLQYNYSDQNKNLNESMITTSTSSLSVNNKKNLQHTNYKTPKKKNFQIPMPKPKNSKQNNQKILDKNSKNTNTINTIVYTKGTIKKFNNQNSNNAFIYNNHNSNLNNNNNNKIYGGSMNHIEMENDNNINHTKRTLNNINGSNINSYMNKSSLNKKRINKVNEEMNKEYNNEVSYFSNNEEETNNQIVNNTINHINNINNYNNYNDQYQKKINSNHRTILKEYDNKFSTGYYSESDQRKEKSAVLNIEEILMTEEKLSAVISCISNGITCEEECFDWFNSYFNTALSNYIEKYFIKEEFIKVIRIAINLNVFSLMLCYDISYNPEAFNELQYKLNEMMNYNHEILILISKYLSNKIIDSKNLWVNKLQQLIMKYDPSIKNSIRIIKDIVMYCNTLLKLIPEILNIYQSPDFVDIFNQIEGLTSHSLYHIYREKIHRIINQNGSIFASSAYFKNNNKLNVSIPVPYLAKKSNKQYTLVLDLDETLIHFKPNPNNEESGTIKIRPYLMEFLEKIKDYYELVVFTAATQEYADPIINALETNKKYFDYRLYRKHTIIIDNDFVKDLSKLGRDMSKTIIVDNMEQNYKLQKSNGITIRPFWGKDNEDTALVDLLDILIKIVDKKMDVRMGLKLFKEDIISKVTSNIFRRSQNRY